MELPSITRHKMCCLQYHKILSLETRNTEKHDERRFGFIKSLHLRKCSLSFSVIRIGPMIPRKLKTIITCTMVKHGETFYDHHMALKSSCSEVK